MRAFPSPNDKAAAGTNRSGLNLMLTTKTLTLGKDSQDGLYHRALRRIKPH